MTLWMVLLVVGVAWISGALFGWGSRELLSQHRRAAADKIWARKQAAEAFSDGQSGAPAAPAAAEPVADAAARTHRFWIAPEDAGKAAAAPAGDEKANPPAAVETPKPSAAPAEAAVTTEPALRLRLSPEPVEAPKAPSQSDVATSAGQTSERQAGKSAQSPRLPEAKAGEPPARPAKTAAAALRASSGPRTVASVQADPDDPDNQPAKPRRRYVDPPKGSDYWRLLDKRSQRPPLTFWLEISVLLVLLSAVAWAVVYFATQPVMGAFM